MNLMLFFKNCQCIIWNSLLYIESNAEPFVRKVVSKKFRINSLYSWYCSWYCGDQSYKILLFRDEYYRYNKSWQLTHFLKIIVNWALTGTKKLMCTNKIIFQKLTVRNPKSHLIHWDVASCLPLFEMKISFFLEQRLKKIRIHNRKMWSENLHPHILVLLFFFKYINNTRKTRKKKLALCFNCSLQHHISQIPSAQGLLILDYSQNCKQKQGD